MKFVMTTAWNKARKSASKESALWFLLLNPEDLLVAQGVPQRDDDDEENAWYDDDDEEDEDDWDDDDDDWDDDDYDDE